jgi:FkbM family methyltransferase
MLNLKHLKHLHAAGAQLGLSGPDLLRWLWSYYGSRFPGAQVRSADLLRIVIRAGRPIAISIRPNGYDCALVEEIFNEKAYALEIGNVARIIDLGGNIGLASLFLAQRYPDAQICCVEPIPDNLSVLRRNIEENKLSIRVIAAAVGARDGQTQFELSSDPRQHAASNSKVVVDRTGRKVDVEVISIPSLLRLMEWDEFDLLKIDIEGGEVEVLAGQPEWLRKVRYIIGEGHVGAGYTIEACRADLEPMGFKVDRIKSMEGAWLFGARRLPS